MDSKRSPPPPELQPDLVVLDLLLPGLDGLEVCRRIQTERPVPVVMLTARDDESDVIIGLGVGADDYMTKAVQSPRAGGPDRGAVLRRSEERRGRTGPDHQLGPIEIWRASRRIVMADRHVNLTPTEFDLLAHLAAASGSVLGRGRAAHGGLGATGTIREPARSTLTSAPSAASWVTT